MKKKLFLLIACVICSALVLAACSNSGSGTSDKNTENAENGADLSELIIGTWEGHCTSDNSEFDDGQDHRWEYKDDGTYVYYINDGNDWVPSNDKMNEYSVDGNVLDTRWGDGSTENREAWEIAIEGDTMKWTAEREKGDGTTYTVTFEMTRVQ